MARYLVVTADDLGLDEGINAGIVRAHTRGLVTSASLLANGPAFEDAVERLAGLSTLGVGVHLNIIRGRPVVPPNEVPSLVTRDGTFPGRAAVVALRLALGRLRLEEVRREWMAQVAAVQRAGLRPTHLDSEKHVHMLPPLFRVALDVAEATGVPWLRVTRDAAPWHPPTAQAAKAALLRACAARCVPTLAGRSVRVADAVCGVTLTGRFTRGRLRLLLAHLPEGVTELICHPGDDENTAPASDAAWASRRARGWRARELSVLCDPSLADLLAQSRTQRTHFGMLP